MSKRFENGYFALVVTCIICLIAIAIVSTTFAFSMGYRSADSEHAAYYAEYEMTQETYSECLDQAPDLNSAMHCIENSEANIRDAERAELNLNVQREMARSAENMLLAAWVVGLLSLLVTAFGVRYVYLTLLATKDMLLATQDMAGDARKIGEAQTRCYIFAEKAEIYWRGDGTPAFRVYLSNSGGTPAKRSWFPGEVELVPANSKRTVDMPEQRTIKPINSIGTGVSDAPVTIHNRTDVEREKIIIDAVKFMKTSLVQHTLFLRGSISYITIFDEIFVTDYEFYVTKIENLTPGRAQKMAAVAPNQSNRVFSVET